MKIDKGLLPLADRFVHFTDYVWIGKKLFYKSPSYGLIQILDVRLMANYDDLEFVEFEDGAHIRTIGSTKYEDRIKSEQFVKIYRAKGDLLFLELDKRAPDGGNIVIIHDLGADSMGSLHEFVKEILESFPRSKVGDRARSRDYYMKLIREKLRGRQRGGSS